MIWKFKNTHKKSKEKNPKLARSTKEGWVKAYCKFCGREFISYFHDHQRYCDRICVLRGKGRNYLNEMDQLRFNILFLLNRMEQNMGPNDLSPKPNKKGKVHYMGPKINPYVYESID